MPVAKRKTSKGETSEYHYRVMVNGKRYVGVCEGCLTKKDALAYEEERRKALSELAAQKSVKALVENFRDKLTGGSKVALKDAFELSLNKPSRRPQNPKQIGQKRSYWRDFLAYMAAKHPGAVNLADVTVAQAEEYVQQLRTGGRFDKTVKQGDKKADYQLAGQLSPGSANVFHGACREVFDKLANDAGLIANPFRAVQKTNAKPEARESFSEAELALIAKNLTPFVKPIFVIGVTTGLREGDICTLRWDEVDMAAGFVSRRTRKTGAMVEIPITPPLAAFLAEQWAVSGTGEHVLPEHARMYLDNPDGVAWRFKRFLEGLGIKTTRKIEGRGRVVSIKDVHSLRHSFCYFAGLHGIPLPVVQSIAGHMTADMTRRYQAHADREAKRKMMTMLPDLMALPGGEPEGEALRREVIDLARAATPERLQRMKEAAG